MSHFVLRLPNDTRAELSTVISLPNVSTISTNPLSNTSLVEYANTSDGHGHDPSHGIMHKDEYALSAGDVILAEEGDYVKVSNESDHDQLVYLRIFDKAGWRGRSPESEKDPQS